MTDPTPPITNAPDAAPPVGPDGEDDLFPRLKGWVKSSLDHLADWRKEAEEAYDFYSGKQWTKEEKAAFEGDGRIAPIFNLTAVNVDAVCGLEVNNRQDVKFLPRTQGDVKVNELLSSAAMWVRDEAQAEDEESDAFKDAVICGLGVTETTLTRDGQGISVDRRDPTECFYDKTAKKANIVDRRYGGRVVMMDTDEAEAMFPDTPITELNAKWASFGLTETKQGEELLDYPHEQRANVGIGDSRPKKVCMVEIEWFDWVGTQKVYHQAFLGQTTILEQNETKGWGYNFITGKRDKKTNTWYGIIRAFIDPQKFINKMISVGTHILATNAKGGLIYERGVFVNPAQAEKDWSNPQKNVEVAEGALSAGKIQPRVAPPFPTGITQLLDFALQIFNRVTGINAEILGNADRDQPASLEAQRRQSAVTILASLFDAKRRYHKEQGETLLQEMKRLPPETLVRVTIDQPQPLQMPPAPPGTPPEQQIAMQEQFAQAQQQQTQQAKQEQFVQFSVIAQAFADPTIKFDVIVDEAPSSPNQQQEIIAKLSIMANSGMALPPEAQAIVVQNIGLPSTIADDIAEAIKGQNPQVAQLQQQLQQGAQLLQKTQAENEQLKQQAALDAEKQKTDQFKAETDRLKARTDALAATGGVPDGDTVVPISEWLMNLERKQDLMGQALLHIQQPQPMGMPQ